MAPLLTAADLAAALGISAYTVLAHARSGRLPCVRIGNRVRFDPELVARLVAEGYNSHHVPSTAETEKAQERDNRPDVVGGVVRERPRARRQRQARSPLGEPRTMRDAVAEICKGIVVREAEITAPYGPVDILTFLDGCVVASSRGEVEPQHQIGDERDD